jgi:hypothetical protein
LTALLALGLAACAGGPVAPDWQADAHQAITAYTRAYLEGRDRVATQELALARRAVARTGKPTALAAVELKACALRFASLGGGDCPGFAPLAADADPASRAYGAYLAGSGPGIDPALLPPVQGEVLRGSLHSEGLPSVADPLSRLVAAAALLRAGRLSPQGIAVAIDTAAQEGWARPLAAWLSFERDRLRAAGDEGGAAARQRRLDIILGAPR